MNVETPRLRIRDLLSSDADAMVELWSDSEVDRWMTGYGPRSPADVESWLQETIRFNESVPRESHNCAIVERATDDVLGWIGFGPSAAAPSEVNFGYALRRRYRGRGYGTEALSAVVDFCVRELGVSVFSGETAEGNLASARVMEKVGLTRAGTSEDGQIAFRFAV